MAISSRPRIRLRVPAKVNPQIRVGPLQEDGYHDITLAYQAVSLYDVLDITLSTGDPSIRITGIDSDRVPANEQNLVIKAAMALANRIGVELRVHFDLVKSIPAEAGLGGGSADAAAALVGCNIFWGSNRSAEELMDIGAYIGEDVPFFINGMMAIGLGHKQPLLSLETGNHAWFWVLGVPFRGLSTKAVFHEYDKCLAECGSSEQDYLRRRKDCTSTPWGDPPASVVAALVNDLETPSTRLLPDIAAVLQAGKSTGALKSLMSGSGSTCAFLARDQAHARQIQEELQKKQIFRNIFVASGPVPGVTVIEE